MTESSRNLKLMNQSYTTPFGCELDLVNKFIDFLYASASKEYLIHTEFEGGFGRPDVLLYSVPPIEALTDIQSLENINPRFAPLLSKRIAKAICSYESLARACGTSESNARSIAKELAKIDRLTFKTEQAQTFDIKPIERQPFKYVVSIEAKLRDWQRALTQAYRYTTFSNESWVLLDEARVSPALKSQQVFNNLGIGLATFSSKGELRVYIKAETRISASSSSLAWRTQALLSRIIASVRTDLPL